MYAASLGGTNPEWVGRVDGIRLYDYAMTRDAVRRTMGTKERTVLVDAGQSQMDGVDQLDPALLAERIDDHACGAALFALDLSERRGDANALPPCL